jgi:hypothetical protein
MLVKYGSFIVFLLITVSCASFSDYGEDVAASFYQVGEALIKDALNRPEISSHLTSSSHAILSSIASKNDYTMPFYDFAVQNYDFHELGFDSEDPQSWNAFINTPFRHFSSQQPDRAQEIINKIVLPSHPFLSQVPFTFETAKFLGQFNPFIEVFLDKVAKDIFAQHFSQILALEDQSEAEILLKDLLRKAKNSSFPDPEFKYHHAFIANAPFRFIKNCNFHHEYHFSINTFISQLASALYYEIAEDSKYLAVEMLSGLLPPIYPKLTDTSYKNTIIAYQESSLQPIDKSYLWDPQQFHGDLLQALKALRTVENFNVPPYLKFVEFLAGDSPLAHLFRFYIVQNYSKPSHINSQDQPLFWRSLIFSSFTDFFTNFPHHSDQILQQLQLLPFLNEVESPFVYGLLDDQISSKDHFLLASDWDHTSTVKLFLQSRTDISAKHAGWALINAVKSRCIPTVKLILQRRPDISDDAFEDALYEAAERGYTFTIELLLHHRADISAYAVGRAFYHAAQSGHTSTLEYLFQSHDHIDISAESPNLGDALTNAAARGYTTTVDFLLQHRTDISANDVGRALEKAVKSKCNHIIELLLQRRTDISANDVGRVLEYAAKGGYTPIVEVLCHDQDFDITNFDAGWGLIDASEGGHASIVDLLLGKTDISASYVEQALKSAVKAGHTLVVELLLQHQHKLNKNS